ncbi:BT4734/BF3469 family protein [Ichthyobacterium seriolicida]
MLDLDNLENAKALKEKITKTPYVLLCFISLSGRVLKIIVWFISSKYG